MYATGTHTPSVDTTNSYTGTFVVDATTQFVTFTTYRSLDTGNPQDDYVIPLDTEMSMIYAYDPNDFNLVYHHGNKGNFKMTISSDGSSSGGDTGGNHDLWYYIHGGLMWTSWTLIGVGQIYTNRYLKHYYTKHQLLHSIFGCMTLVFTTTAACIAFNLSGWAISTSLHAICGMITGALGILLSFGGISALITRKLVNMDWQTARLLQMGRFHGIFGYVVIFVS